jgi:hypothetical protein
VSAPPESFLEQYRARWDAVGHHDPLSAGMYGGSKMARRSTLRAGELVTEGFELEDAVLVNLHVYDDASVAAVVAVMRAVL